MVTSTPIVNWNIGWASPRSPRGKEILRRIKKLNPEIACLTEAKPDFLEGWSGDIICSNRNYSGNRSEGHKVLLWSKNSWEQKDTQDNAELPKGRFVSGITKTSIGELAVIGVCIPYSASRTQKYVPEEEKCKYWQEHKSFLTYLKDIIKQKIEQHNRLIMIGDFNQPINTPIYIKNILTKTLDPYLRIVTGDLKQQCQIKYKGECKLKNKSNIDHVAISNQLSFQKCCIIDEPNQKLLSANHFEIFVDLINQDSAL